MSLYADYINEKNGDEIIEEEYGFATYRYIGSDTVYIIDIYVKGGNRNTYSATTMADKILGLAKAKGCKKLIGTVSPAAKNSTTSLMVLLGYGMKLVSSSADCILFEKEI